MGARVPAPAPVMAAAQAMATAVTVVTATAAPAMETAVPVTETVAVTAVATAVVTEVAMAAEPSRVCACVDFATTNVIETLAFESMKKIYGRIVSRENPVPWGRCKICQGSGIDRRP